MAPDDGPAGFIIANPAAIRIGRGAEPGAHFPADPALGAGLDHRV
jgi:hypothetical protein